MQGQEVQWATFSVLTLTLIAVIVYALEARRQARATTQLLDESRKQTDTTIKLLNQAARAHLDATRSTHNWQMFANEVEPGLPGLPTIGENREYWKYRMVHLDHLNLLATRWEDYQDNVMSHQQLQGWVRWSRLLLQVLKDDRDYEVQRLGYGNSDKHIQVTRQLMDFGIHPRLKALLHITELHGWDLWPAEFVDWLLDVCGYSELHLSRVEDDD